MSSKLDEKLNKMAVECLHMLGEGKTYHEIALAYDCSKDYIYSLMKEYKKIWGFEGTLTKYHWLKYSGKIEELVDKYVNDKMSTIALGKIYGAADHTIATWLRKENVIIRSVGYESRTNQSLFQNIITEEQAYTIGLITADGSITKDNHSISITLQLSDKYLLEQINEKLLNNSGHILNSHKEDGNKARAVLQFHGKQLCEQLNTFGIVYNKTYLLEKLSESIPDTLYHHYIRGLYDGDGVCSYYTKKGTTGVRIGFCGYNAEFIKSYRDFCNDVLDMPKNKLFNTGHCWQVSWSAKKDLQNFYNYIYEDATIFLGRKKKKLFDYLS